VAQKQYDHESIKALEDIEHIRSKAGMYIGVRDNPNHLLYELLDNSLDEAQGGFANLIGIQIDNKDSIVSIADNGRGIPFKNDTVPLLATKLFTGGKFEKGEDEVYKIATGLHGIGIVAVNALSNFMEVTVYRDNKKAWYRFEDAKVVDSKITNHPSSDKPFSSQIKFQPSKKYFESLRFDIASIRDRMKIASIHEEKLNLILFIDGKREIINCNLKNFFRSSFQIDEKKHEIPILTIDSKVKDESVKVMFTWDVMSSTAPKALGCVNILKVNEGTHVNKTFETFRNVFEKLAAKEKVAKFNKSDCTVGIRVFTSIMMYDPEYSSQTKEKLAVPKKSVQHLYKDLEKKLLDIMTRYPETTRQLFAFWDSYRRRRDSSRNIIKTTGKGVTRLNSTVDSKLRDCTSHSVGNSELFIVEGTSAGGTLIQARDPKIHAVLGLKGKIPNIADDKKDALKNKEIIEIINALGTGIEPDFNMTGLRYGKIIFSCDADADGGHISALLNTVFLKLTPKLFNEGRVFMAVMPLYGAQVKKQFVPIYSDEELTKFKQKFPNIKIQRYKGLGEMNADQLAICLFGSHRRLRKIEHPKDPNTIFKLMTTVSEKRKLV